MKFDELISALGIKSYPEALKERYETLIKSEIDITDTAYITEIQKKYNLLGKYFDLVISATEKIKKNEALCTWGKLVASYNLTVTSYEAQRVVNPEQDGTSERDILPLLILLAEVPSMVARFKERGFSEAQIIKNLDNYRINLWVCELISGRPMLDRVHYNWICYYTRAEIFDHKALNFQAAIWGSDAIILKNRKTGDFFPMMRAGRFHRNGLILGSKGCEDDEGAFSAEFREEFNVFIGHLVKGGRVERKLSILKKSEWECVLRPGDDVISVHIPRETNFDPEHISECLREGMELSKKYYPEISPRYLVCYSWLLDPTLVKILGEGAKISSFIERFLKYPLFSNGTSGLSYIFAGYQDGPIESYPEKTTLQRGVKKLMLEGEYIHGTAGVIVNEL